MGTDVVLWVIADPSAERLAKAEEIFCASNNMWDRDRRTGLVLKTDVIMRRPIVRVYTLSRYYDGGKRGHWPEIYKAIRAMQELFPESDVYYHGDGVSIWEVFEYGWIDGDNPDPYIRVTEKSLSENWQAWLTSDPYDGLEKDVAW